MERFPILFAHRGLHSSARENTLPAFDAAAQSGVNGMETDLWLTADGSVVCDHDGTHRRFIRNISFAKLNRAELPDYVPQINDVFAKVGVDFDFSFDVKNRLNSSEIITKVVTEFAQQGGDLSRLWFCYEGNETAVMKAWVTYAAGANIVHSSPLKHIRGSTEKHAATLAEMGVATMNMPVSDWNLGFTTLFHRFGVKAFAYATRYERELLQAQSYRVDGVYSDNVPAMLSVYASKSN